MSKGYTSVLNISSYVGQTLTSAQQTWATTLMDPAEQLIDLYTRVSWSPSNVVITGEYYDLRGDSLYLRSVPVVSIQSIQTRTHLVGDVATTLTAGTDYELQNAATGLVKFSSGFAAEEANEPSEEVPLPEPGAYEDDEGVYALVSYTASQPVPADITQATTMLIAHWLGPNLDPLRFEAIRLKVGSGRMVEYDPNDIPVEVRTILDLRKRAGVFA